jgi:hypothetical protein
MIIKETLRLSRQRREGVEHVYMKGAEQGPSVDHGLPSVSLGKMAKD